MFLINQKSEVPFNEQLINLKTTKSNNFDKCSLFISLVRIHLFTGRIHDPCSD